jgi:glycosyltransferase involved in cell wall biosynthesis
MYKLALAQVKAGHQPVIYSGDYKFDHELTSRMKGVIFRVVHSWLDRAGFSIMPQLVALARKEVPGFDAVHMHVYRSYQNAVLWHFCQKYGVPIIMDAHGAVPYYRRKKFIKRVFDRIWGRRMLHDAAWLVAETEVGVNEYLEIDPTLDRSKIVVISPPFDTEQFAVLPQRGAFRKSLGIGPDEPVVMFLGRIHQIKGNDFLIKGFAELVKRGVPGKLVLVGPDGGHQQECEELARSLGVSDRVIFTGFMDGEKKLSALVDADVVTQMSRQEQGAWAPIEAVLCGTPIVVTAHTGSGEDVRRLDAGYTVDFDDVPRLAEALEFVLTHRAEAKEKTLKAKAFIEQHMSFNTRVNEYTVLYRRRMNEAHPGG